MLQEATGISFKTSRPRSASGTGRHPRLRPGRRGQAQHDVTSRIAISQAVISTFLDLFFDAGRPGRAPRDCTEPWQMPPIEDRPKPFASVTTPSRSTRGTWSSGSPAACMARPLLRQATTSARRRATSARRRTARRSSAAWKTRCATWRRTWSAATGVLHRGRTCRRTPLGESNADAGVDFGNSNGRPGRGGRRNRQARHPGAGRTASFREDAERLVLGKARQLYTAAAWPRHPQPANSPLPAPARRIVPIVVEGGQFPSTRSP